MYSNVECFLNNGRPFSSFIKTKLWPSMEEAFCFDLYKLVNVVKYLVNESRD